MSFLLDTNICSAHIRRPAGLAHRFMQYSGMLWMPSIVLGELYAGAHLLDEPARILAAIADLRRDVAVLVYDERCAEEFGRLRGILRRLGVAANPVDLMVAAVALVHGLTLVTHNVRDFANIPGLHVVDWLAP